jgi:hypothetical protein
MAVSCNFVWYYLTEIASIVANCTESAQNLSTSELTEIRYIQLDKGVVQRTRRQVVYVVQWIYDTLTALNRCCLG